MTKWQLALPQEIPEAEGEEGQGEVQQGRRGVTAAHATVNVRTLGTLGEDMMRPPTAGEADEVRSRVSCLDTP